MKCGTKCKTWFRNDFKWFSKIQVKAVLHVEEKRDQKIEKIRPGLNLPDRTPAAFISFNQIYRNHPCKMFEIKCIKDIKDADAPSEKTTVCCSTVELVEFVKN